MRVIAGEFKGRRLKVPAKISARPMTDRVREAVFSSLQSLVDMHGAVVLDLFAGTGALGIEALSRGAESVVFIERDRILCASIEETLTEFGLAARGRVICGDVQKALSFSQAGPGTRPAFDLVFIAPPYAAHPGLAVVSWLVQARIVSASTIVVIESEKHTVLEEKADFGSLNLQRKKSKNYGATVISYYGFFVKGE